MTTELFNALCNGIAVFAYIRKDGNLRTAVGTLNAMEIAKVSPRTSVGDVAIALKTNRYFDLQAGGWRRIAYNDRVAKSTLIGSLKNGKMEFAEIA